MDRDPGRIPQGEMDGDTDLPSPHWRLESDTRGRPASTDRVSQVIHDTAAQSAYVLGLGIDTARMLAGHSNDKLNEALTVASMLSRSIIWELRADGVGADAANSCRELREHSLGVGGDGAVRRDPGGIVAERDGRIRFPTDATGGRRGWL